MSETQASILVVDDHADNLRTLAAILSIEGYKVRKAISGKIALETVSSQPPDLILLDIRMPQMDGYEVCSILKADAATREIPVIFLSALSETEDKVKGFAVGGVDYITKPFQAEEVIARIENQLRLQRLSVQLIEQNAQLQYEICTRQQTEVILEQEIEERKKAEEQLKHNSQTLANFSSNLKQLHRLTTSSYNTFDELFADYLQTGCEMLGFPTGIISQINNQTYTILAVKSDLDSLKPNLELNLGDSRCAEVVKTQQTIAYTHVGAIPRIQKHPVDPIWKIESYIGTPIVVNGEIYGTLNFSSTQIRRQSFANKEKELIELMAQSLAREIATHQAQLQREQAEEALRLSAIRIRHQNQELMELARNPALNQGELLAAVQAITQATAQDIAVERASVWLFDATGTYLQCLDLYEHSLNQHSQGLELVVADYPTYFHALIHEQLIVADDAYTAPETQEFSQVYLTPLGITSMLDAPIRLGGKTVGVLCCENVGIPRHFSPEDENFARSAADLVSLALEARERKQAQEQLRQAHVQLEQHSAELAVTNSQLQNTLEELQLAEEELQEQNEELATSRQLVEQERQRYQDLFKFAPDGYVVTDAKGVIQEVNQATANLLGVGKGVLIGKSISVFIPLPERPKFRTQLNQLANRQHSVQQWELNLQPRHGNPFTAAITIAAVHDVQSQLVGLRWLVRDITDRKQAEKALRESEMLYRQMFEVNTAVKLLINPSSGKIVDANPAAQRFYGYELEQLKRMKITDLNVLPPEQVVAQMAQTVSEQQGEFEFRHRLASGEIRDIAVYSTPISQQGQELLYSIILDITQRKQAERALQQATQREREKAQQLTEALEELKRTQSQLIQTEKMSSLGQLIAGVAHEVNNPVSFIYGNLIYARQYFQNLLSLLEIYQQTYPNPTPEIQALVSEIDLEFLLEDWSKLIDSMQIGAERIHEMVRSLLLFSRLNQAELKSCDIHEGIDNTLLILKHRLRTPINRPPIEVIKHYGQLPEVTCYIGQLNQVFMNLLSNAIDALETQPEPRLITIRTSLISQFSVMSSTPEEPLKTQNGLRPATLTELKTQNSQSVVIQIADNGSGMKEEILHQIFDPFFTTKPVGRGTGLGLAICHQIVVEKHGGQLRCVSAPGKGTEFIVEIPLRCTD